MSEFTDGLRALAEWFDNHSEHEVGYITTYLNGPHGSYNDSGNWVDSTQEEQIAWLSTVTKAFGSCEKRPASGSYSVVKNFGGGVKAVATSYDACKKVVTGSHTEVVEEPVETVTRTKKVTKVVEDFEYECPKSLLS